jgi:hypothetical protein
VAELFAYEDFFDPAEVETFLMVKRGQQVLASVVREELAVLVGGQLDHDGKEFLHTSEGVFRVALRSNSDNTTERAAHRRMGVETLNAGDLTELGVFLVRHPGVRLEAVGELVHRVEQRMRELALDGFLRHPAEVAS